MAKCDSVVISRCLMLGIILFAMMSCGSSVQPTIDIPTQALKQGDIAFRKGEGIVSEIVLHSDADGLYSHIGIIVIHNDSIKVVHSVPGEGDFDGVKIEPIEVFYAPNRAVKGEIMRMPLTDSQRSLISERALEKASQRVIFDHDYDIEDTTKLYCTELVELLFAQCDVDLSQNRMTEVNVPGFSGKYIMPSDIYKNTNLTTIFKY